MTPMLMTALFVAIGLYIRSARTARRSRLRSLAVIRKCRRRRDVLADQCAALIEEAKSVNETACELMLELDEYKFEERARAVAIRDARASRLN